MFQMTLYNISYENFFDPDNRNKNEIAILPSIRIKIYIFEFGIFTIIYWKIFHNQGS